MPAILIYKLLGGVALALALWGVVAFIKQKGYDDAVSLYRPLLEAERVRYGTLEAQVKASDALAKTEKLKQVKDNEKIKVAHDQRIATIHAYYTRLRKNDIRGQADIDSGAASGGDHRDDDPSEESASTRLNQTITGCPAVVEQACALDAGLAVTWQEWARRHNIPIE